MLLNRSCGIVTLGALVALGAWAAETETKPALSQASAARFLTQATWGPTPESVAHLQAIGFEDWLDEQLNVGPSTISDVPLNEKGRAPLAPMQQEFFVNAVHGKDQLRQRVAFALGQIWVVSAVKLRDATRMVPYLRLLSRDAFENYRKLMYDVTLSPAMGHYLDMVNNDKANPVRGTSPNENYARELLQLFTVGLNQLNSNGTMKTDWSGKPIPVYNQEHIEEFARALTGWTYAPKAGAMPKAHNPPNWDAPMVAVERLHDTGPKALLSDVTLPAGRTAEQDLNDALDNVFRQDTMAPFICRQFIQHLVVSDPSPDYVARVVDVFNNYGGVRGDLKAVVKAILLDREARRGDITDNARFDGHLREPVLMINGLLRALGAQVGAPNSLPQAGSALGQNVYFPPTVFNYFPPAYRIEGTDFNAPEFGILTPATAMGRADFVNSVIFGRRAGVTVDLTPFAQLAPTPSRLLGAVGEALFGGPLPAALERSILPAVNAAQGSLSKARTVLYLASSSGYYQVAQ